MRASIENMRKTYDAVADWYDQRGYMPSLREVADALGLSSPSTARARLMVLRDMGCVDYQEHKPRTIYLLRRP